MYFVCVTKSCRYKSSFYQLLLARSKLHQSDRNVVLDEATRSRRQRKALEALEKDNYQDNLPSLSTYVSEHRIQLNKKFQQKFTISEELASVTSSSDSTREIGGSLSTAATSSSSLQTPSGPSIAETCIDQGSNKRKRVKAESKLRFRKNFATLLEEEVFLIANQIRFFFYLI